MRCGMRNGRKLTNMRIKCYKRMVVTINLRVIARGGIISLHVLVFYREMPRKRRNIIINPFKRPYKLWLDKRVFDERLIENNVFPEPLELQINAILAKLESYGDRDKRFEKDWKRIWNGLRQKEADHYEPAFRDFGTFLGYQTERPTGKGTPDSVWQLASTWLVFELKTNIENAGGLYRLKISGRQVFMING